MRFCKQRGEVDPADAGKRAQDRHVTLRLMSRRVVGGLRQSCGETVDLASDTGALCGDDVELREDDLEMGDGSLVSADGNDDGGSRQCGKDGCGVEASHTMALEEPGDGADTQTPGLGGRRGQRPEFPHPGAGESLSTSRSCGKQHQSCCRARLTRRVRSTARSLAMRNRSRSSTTSGVTGSRRWNARASVRRASPSTRASRRRPWRLPVRTDRESGRAAWD